MYDVWAVCGSLKVADAPDEGDDGVGVVRDTKVRPACVMELLHLPAIVALETKSSHMTDHMSMISDHMKYYQQPSFQSAHNCQKIVAQLTLFMRNVLTV